MPKSSKRGARTSGEAEVAGVTPHAVWVLAGGRELMLDFARFPWFSDATMAEICDVEFLHGQHLRWPKLDVDLHIDSVENPERFPLVSRTSRAPTKRRRSE
ncbi:MAG TPA: DUF2442 domain-containing protein [Polyangiaceae bacterium]|jgi:hypothetical protein|nr:DUF2442 domain-containing protein [Polyangiaceae bacterium]